MLELAADGKLALSQDEPFGDIHVAAHVGGP
jgi:chromatin segregation and condensation protein Rec8/ScpA/Scc1 (kleisin family)